jgi:hypothetical protein
MRGFKRQRRVDWWAIATVPVAMLVMLTAKEHGAPFWMQLLFVAAEAAVLGLLIGLVVRTVRHRKGVSSSPSSELRVVPQTCPRK